MRFVDEAFFLARDRVEERRKKGLGAVGEIERQGLDVLPDAIQSRHSRGLGKDTGSEGDVDVGKEQRCGADAKIMAGQAEGREIIFGHVREKVVAGLLVPPELEESRAGRH